MTKPTTNPLPAIQPSPASLKPYVSWRSLTALKTTLFDNPIANVAAEREPAGDPAVHPSARCRRSARTAHDLRLVGQLEHAHHILLAAGEQLGEGPCVVRLGQPVAERVQLIDVQAGGVGLGLPQGDQPTTPSTSNMRSDPWRHSSTLVTVTGLICDGSRTSPLSSPSSITTIGPWLPATPPTNPYRTIGNPSSPTSSTRIRSPGRNVTQHPVARRHHVAQLGPSDQRFGRPGVEGPIGQRDAGERPVISVPRIHPQEGTGAAEMTKRGGRIGRSGPMRVLLAADLEAEAPRAGVEPADTWHEPRQGRDCTGAVAVDAIGAETRRGCASSSPANRVRSATLLHIA